MQHTIRTSCLVLFAASLSGCAGEAPIVEAQGECADVFQARVCTWAKTRGDSLVEIGVTVPVASLESAPSQVAMVWPPAAAATLKLPAAVAQQSGLTEFTMFWENMGHPPATFMTPHFDFHFYTIPTDERMAIDCSDVSKPAELPAGYALPDEALPPEMVQLTGVSTLVGICVPQMGMHSLLASELERQETFGGTMVVGYYRARPIFIEPMVSRAMLLQKNSFDLPIPAIPGMSGAHPTTFHAEYDAAQSAYRFVFSGFSPAA